MQYKSNLLGQELAELSWKITFKITTLYLQYQVSLFNCFDEVHDDVLKATSPTGSIAANFHIFGLKSEWLTLGYI